MNFRDTQFLRHHTPLADELISYALNRISGHHLQLVRDIIRHTRFCMDATFNGFTVVRVFADKNEKPVIGSFRLQHFVGKHSQENDNIGLSGYIQFMYN